MVPLEKGIGARTLYTLEKKSYSADNHISFRSSHETLGDMGDKRRLKHQDIFKRTARSISNAETWLIGFLDTIRTRDIKGTFLTLSDTQRSPAVEIFSSPIDTNGRISPIPTNQVVQFATIILLTIATNPPKPRLCGLDVELLASCITFLPHYLFCVFPKSIR